MNPGTQTPNPRPVELPPLNPHQNPPQPASYQYPALGGNTQSNHLPPIQGAPQQAIILQQPNQRKYASKCSIGLGATQVTIGILCIIFQIAAICVGTHVAFVSHGIWCGLFFCLCGALGIAAGKKETTCLIVSHMILCIVAAAFFVLVLIGLSAAGLGYDINNYSHHGDYQDYHDYGSKNCHWDYSGSYSNGTSESTWVCCDYDFNGTYTCTPDPNGPIYYADAYWPDYELNDSAIAMSSVLLFLAVFEMIIAICASIVGCKSCCCNFSQTPRNAVATFQVQYLPTAGPSQGTAPQILIIQSNGQPLQMGQVSAQYPSAGFIVQQPQGGTNMTAHPSNPVQPPEYRKSSPPPGYSAN